MNNRPRIVFMGTPDFAVASLGALLMNNLNVVAVVTTPDKPAGRGRALKSSAVAQYASENYLNVLKPHNLKDHDFIRMIRSLEPDIIIVVAFRMLPKQVWEIPSIGTFNLHASLLPQYRGAAPINHVIINGETRTGVTTFLIDDKIDTGSILLRKEIPISHEESAGDLHDRLMREGAKLLVRTTELLYLDAIKPVDQSNFIKPEDKLMTAPKIFPDDCIINWESNTIDIYNKIRGLSPYPGARTSFTSGGKTLQVKLLKAHPNIINHDYTPGTIISENRKELGICTGDGIIEIVKLHPEGKRKMNTDEFLRGFDISGFIAT